MTANIKSAEAQQGFTFDDECLVGFKKAEYSASFNDNIQIFLAQSCEKVDNVGYPTWFSAIAGPAECDKLPLYIIKENVEDSPNPFCSSCKITGWGHHFVSRNKYHFCIPGKNFCKSPTTTYWNSPVKLNDVGWAKALRLNGVIHANGFGHLYKVADTSEFPSEHDLMNLWDFLCSTLKTRAISNLVKGKNEQKTWNIEQERIDKDDDHGKIPLVCEAIPEYYRVPTSPGILLSVSAGICKGKLQDMIQHALKQIFFVTQKYTVTDIEGMKGLQDSEAAPVTFGQVLRVKGEGLNVETDLTFEDGESLKF